MLHFWKLSIWFNAEMLLLVSHKFSQHGKSLSGSQPSEIQPVQPRGQAWVGCSDLVHSYLIFFLDSRFFSSILRRVVALVAVAVVAS